MKMRLVLLACTIASMGAFSAHAVPADAQRCEASTVRVYFAHGSTTLDPLAREVLGAAQHGMTDCARAELQIRVDAASAASRARGEAVLAAANGRAWNATRIVALSRPLSVDVSSAPEYVEVAMSPDPIAIPENEAPLNPNVGA